MLSSEAETSAAQGPASVDHEEEIEGRQLEFIPEHWLQGKRLTLCKVT